LTQQNASNGKSDRSDRDSYSNGDSHVTTNGFKPIAGYDEAPAPHSESTFEIDCALVDGVETWRLWDGVNNRLVSCHPTEAAALAAVPR
jgi:hypothetical protein